MELDKIYNMDAFDGMKQIPDKSVNLAIIDPPYNIGVTTQVNGKKILNQWDKIDNYQEWMRALHQARRQLRFSLVLHLGQGRGI